MTSTSAATIIRTPRRARLTVERELHAAGEQQEAGDHGERQSPATKIYPFTLPDFTKT